MFGWKNKKFPDGFLAPNNIIPGKDGRYIEKSIIDETINIPGEF